MFKKFLLRSLAGATAIGSALALSLVATPGGLPSAPEIRNVSCVQYPSRAATTTDVSVPWAAAYGTATRATATVSSGAGTPTGSVKFILLNDSGSVLDTWTKDLSSGKASVWLPRSLPAGQTYTVRGRYDPGCSPFAGSGDTAYYTVEKATTTTSVNAPDVKRGADARVSVVVSSKVFTPRGNVRIIVVRNGMVIASTTRTLSRGRASATFGKYRVGSYTAKATYLGARNFSRSQGSDGFHVLR